MPRSSGMYKADTAQKGGGVSGGVYTGTSDSRRRSCRLGTRGGVVELAEREAPLAPRPSTPAQDPPRSEVWSVKAPSTRQMSLLGGGGS